ncbi:unnamed protein product [Caenorhabditis auriculariae]|uniref:Cell division control protein 45 homolog n=1 Tax=Caenorhabditis auriculariae TaxID=2777116 RepID=A0A8S1GYS9_9PELO|nr:unnamed protein product [Caenorhabditis auriculariae]
MLIKDNFRYEFYDVIKKQSVVLVVSTDLDALCAALVLSHLLKCDDIAYTIVAVDGWQDVERTFSELQDQKTSIVMLNCGAGRPITNIPDDSTVFIVDSHRPFHHENVFDPSQIRLIVDSSELNDLSIPEPRQVMDYGSGDDDDDEGSEVDAESEEGTYESRLERVRRRAIKKEEKKLWERRRQDILWRYYETSWHSVPSSMRLLELAASLNRTSAELMWFAAVGLNSQFVDRLISIEAYTAVCIDRMRPFIHKFSPRNIATKVDDSLRISFEKELPIALYAHWDLYSAMMVDEYFSIKTKNWTQKGDLNIRHLLASLGITLSETKQKFEALSTEQRKTLTAILEKEMSSAFATFFVHLGYSCKLNAADVARAVILRLEVPQSTKAMDRFVTGAMLVKASIAGTKQQRTHINYTFEKMYQRMLGVLWKSVASAINQSEILPTGPFYLYTCSRSLDEDLAASRHFLFNFSSFLLRAFAASRKGRSGKPLVVTFPLGGDRSGWIVVTGVMPLATVYEDTHLKTCMGRAFERVKKMAPKVQINADYFDSDVILLKSEDRARFFDCLQSILETGVH